MPPNASWSKPLDIRTPPLAGFKDTFYRDPNASLPLDPPILGGLWERNFGRAPSTVTVDYTKFVALEKMLRRTAATVSSIDVLVAGLRKHSADWEGMSEEQRSEASGVTARLTGCLTLAISHAAALSVRASASCMQTRRKAALDNIRSREIPDPLREWLLCQPLPTEKSSLFGPVVPTLLKELAVDVNELRKGIAFIAKPARSDPKPDGGFARGKKRRLMVAAQLRSTKLLNLMGSPVAGAAGATRAVGRKGRGKSSFSFPAPVATPPKGEPSQRS